MTIFHDFKGQFNISDWTISENTGHITTNVTNTITDSITLVSGNSYIADYATISISTTIDTTINFDWNGTTQDTSRAYLYDQFGYILNGVRTLLSNNNSSLTSGSMSLSLVIGDTFGFYANTLDGIFGSSTTTITNFTFTYNPISNICFPKGTLITTNQGNIPIEKINPDIHTIRNKKIVAITQTITKDKYLVCFNKNVLGNNIPSQKTIVSNNHCILYKGHMVKAKNFIDKIENVKKVKYTGEILYNVLMEEADKMMVNNLICETLDPANGIAKLYTILSKLTLEEQLNKIKEWNEYVGGRDPLTPDKGRSRLHFS